MKLKELTVFTADLDLANVYHHSGGRIETYEQVYLKIVAQDETTGYAEIRGNCPYVTGEERDDVLRAMQKEVLPMVAGTNIDNINDTIDRVNRSVTSYGARTLVDVALHDLASKIRGIPLYAYLGEKRRNAVKGFCGVTFADSDQTEKKIKSGIAEGRTLFKVRVGLEPVEADLERLALVRSLAPTADVAIDANGAWSAEEAVKRIKLMERFDLVFVEQPVAGNDFEGLGYVKERTSIPLMADETLVSMAALERLIDQSLVDMVNVKILKAGGLLNLGRMIRRLDRAGMAFQFDSMSSGRLDSAATLHAQCSIGAHALYFGGGGFGYIRQDSSMGLEFENGELVPPESPGLGVMLDETRCTPVFSTQTL